MAESAVVIVSLVLQWLHSPHWEDTRRAVASCETLIKCLRLVLDYCGFSHHLASCRRVWSATERAMQCLEADLEPSISTFAWFDQGDVEDLAGGFTPRGLVEVTRHPQVADIADMVPGCTRLLWDLWSFSRHNLEPGVDADKWVIDTLPGDGIPR